MSEAKMLIAPGMSPMCSRCKYHFMSKQVGDDIIVRHTTSFDPDLPWYLVYKFAECPLQGKRFRFPAMQQIVLEEAQ